MNKLCKIANGLDVFFRIAYWLCIIFAVFFLVAQMILPFMDETIAESFTYSYHGIQFRFDEPDGNPSFLTENRTLAYSITFAMAIAGFILSLLAIRIIRQILKPMKEGKPFEAGISGKFKALGIFAIIYGVISNLVNFAGQQIVLNTLEAMEAQELLVSVNCNFDLSFVLVAVMLFLCSYIFCYGEELQTQADETL